MEERKPIQRRWIINFVLLLLILSGAAMFAGVFVASERTFHVSDWAFYHGMATDLAVMMRQSPVIAYEWVKGSLDDVYNKLYIVPLLPLLLLFGEGSRLVYIVGLTLVYVVPLSLVMGAIAVRLIAAKPHHVFWSGVCVTLLFPAIWIPTFQGYPDVGGALLVMGAFLVFIQDIELKRIRQALGIGALLASAILFRRHFAYDVVTLLGAIAIHSYGQSLTQPTSRQIWAQLRHFTGRLGVIIIAMGGLLSLISWKWVYTTLTTNYSDLYASFSVPPALIMQDYIAFYGWAVWFFVIAGLGVGLIHPMFHRSAVRVLGIWLVLCLGLWIFYLRYRGTQYTLNFSPLLSLGIVLLFWFVNSQITQQKRRRTIVACLTVILAVNAVIGLTSLGKNPMWGSGSLFSLNHAPPVRSDYDELVRLVNYLRDSSDVPLQTTIVTTITNLSPDLPTNAERQLYPRPPRKLQGPGLPTVDSSGWFPVLELMTAQRLVVTQPFEHILEPEDEEIIEVIHDIFEEKWEFSKDFRRLPVSFALSSGTGVFIYERVRPTSTAVMVRTLARMQERVKPRPGNQTDWILLRQPFPITGILPRSNDAYWLKTAPADRDAAEPTELLYIGSLQARNQITAQVKLPPEGCPGLKITFTALDQAGRSLQAQPVNQATSGALAVTLDSPSTPQYLLMTLTWSQKLPQVCPVELEQVEIAGGS